MTEKLHHPFLHHRSRRFHIIIMLMYAFFCLCQISGNIGMSTSCMCNSTAVAISANRYEVPKSPMLFNSSLELDDTSCTKLQGKVFVDYGGTFVWSTSMQSWVVSGMFVGGFLLSYPSGYAVDHYSTRHLISIAIGMLTFASLILPTLAWNFGAYGAIAARVIMGFGEALLIPSLNSMVTKWIPLHEKSLAAAIFTSGNQVSGMFGNPLVAELCAYPGWPAIFYTGAGFGAVWLILWHLTVRNSPSNTRWIQEEEVDYIVNHIPRRDDLKSIKIKTPWREMLSSSVFWCLIYNSVIGNLMIALIFVYIPVYFKDVLMLDVKSNGFFSAAPHLCNFVAKIFWGGLMDRLRQRKILSPTATVKLSQTVSMLGIGISCYILRFMDCSTPIPALLLLCGVTAFFGLSISGFYTSLLSVAPSHIGTLTSLGTVIGFIGRMGAPYTISIFKTIGTADEWANILLVYVFASISAAVVFFFFGSGDVQEWDYSKKHPSTQTMKSLVESEEKN